MLICPEPQSLVFKMRIVANDVPAGCIAWKHLTLVRTSFLPHLLAKAFCRALLPPAVYAGPAAPCSHPEDHHLHGSWGPCSPVSHRERQRDRTACAPSSLLHPALALVSCTSCPGIPVFFPSFFPFGLRLRFCYP